MLSSTAADNYGTAFGRPSTPGGAVARQTGVPELAAAAATWQLCTIQLLIRSGWSDSMISEGGCALCARSLAESLKHALPPCHQQCLSGRFQHSACLPASRVCRSYHVAVVNLLIKRSGCVHQVAEHVVGLCLDAWALAIESAESPAVPTPSFVHFEQLSALRGFPGQIPYSDTLVQCLPLSTADTNCRSALSPFLAINSESESEHEAAEHQKP